MSFLNLLLGAVLRWIAVRVVAREWSALEASVSALAAEIARGSLLAPPIQVVQLLISGEDHRHRLHSGCDPVAIARAIYRRVVHGKVEGASTVPQQLVRVVTGRYERTIMRKLREILLAALLDRQFPKHLVPKIYLAIAYYGTGIVGYENACKRLRIAPTNPSIADAARVVARLKYPEPWEPTKRSRQRIEARAQHLLALHCIHRIGRTYQLLDEGLTNGYAVHRAEWRMRSPASVPNVGPALRAD